jgi:hypothetical protein
VQGRTKQHHAEQFAYLGLRTRTGCNFKQIAGSIVAFPVPVPVVAIAIAVPVAVVDVVAIAVAVVAVAVRPLIGRSVLISIGALGVIVHLGPTRRILIAVAKAVVAVTVAITVAIAIVVAAVAVAVRPMIGRSVLISTGVLGVIVHLGPTRRILIAVAKAVVAVAITGSTIVQNRGAADLFGGNIAPEKAPRHLRLLFRVFGIRAGKLNNV